MISLQVNVAFSVGEFQKNQQQAKQEPHEQAAAMPSSVAAESIPRQEIAPQTSAADPNELENGIRWPSAAESLPFWKRAPRGNAMTLGEAHACRCVLAMEMTFGLG